MYVQVTPGVKHDDAMAHHTPRSHRPHRPRVITSQVKYPAIINEQQLRFQVTVEPDGGPVWVDLTGPPGAREFLAQMIKG